MDQGYLPEDPEEKALNNPPAHPASFRDPAGGIVIHLSRPYRVVDASHLSHLKHMETSGLQTSLFESRSLIPHRVLDKPFPFETEAAAVLEPEPLRFVSHPYEWCFSQWKEAALLTLDLAVRARKYEMILKDASAYNVQFHEGVPLWIDTLSFEFCPRSEPWVAYRQFCRHFLATLAAMSRIHSGWGLYFRSRMDGFDLREVSRALPFLSRFDPFLAGHLHLQARVENRPLKPGRTAPPPRMSETMLRGLLDDLNRGIRRMRPPSADTHWSDYSQNLPYPPEAVEKKRRVVESWIRDSSPGVLWDLGSNTGDFSLTAASDASFVLALDSDHGSVERLWERVRRQGVRNVLPLWMDLSNPSPAQGWIGRERSSLFDRGPADMALALALVHHLTFSSLVPLDRQADFFALCGRRLILEFPGPDDPQVRAMAAGRGSLLAPYRSDHLEQVFSRSFRILEKVRLCSSERILYRMVHKGVLS